MRRSAILQLVLLAALARSAAGDLIITGVIDGPRTGGVPKAIELYATVDIVDLSIFNVETPNNGGTATGMEFALSGSASAGQYLWVATETAGFTAYFGFAPTFVANVANVNGDDNVILYRNTLTIDQFGVNGEDGTGEPWEYEDGFAYRKNETGPDATFEIDNWNFSGVNYLDSQGSGGVNGSDGKTVPFGTFSPAAVPEASSFLFGALVCGVLALRFVVRKTITRTAA